MAFAQEWLSHCQTARKMGISETVVKRVVKTALVLGTAVAPCCSSQASSDQEKEGTATQFLQGIHYINLIFLYLSFSFAPSLSFYQEWQLSPELVQPLLPVSWLSLNFIFFFRSNNYWAPLKQKSSKHSSLHCYYKENEIWVMKCKGGGRGETCRGVHERTLSCIWQSSF